MMGFALFNLIMGIMSIRINFTYVSIFFTVFLGSVLIGSGFLRMQYDAFEAIRLLKAGGYILLITDFVSIQDIPGKIITSNTISFFFSSVGTSSSIK